MKICNNFYSGSCFKNECEIFKDYLEIGDFIISGFSYGAIKAFNQALESKARVDKLQLFSPAFFQTKDEKFKRMQLMFFKKDEDAYIKNFLENLKDKSTKSIENFFKKGSFKELDELLNFKWNKEDLEELIKKGIKIAEDIAVLMVEKYKMAKDSKDIIFNAKESLKLEFSQNIEKINKLKDIMLKNEVITLDDLQ